MYKQPDVSVVIPSYNHEDFIEEAIYSALHQQGFQYGAPGDAHIPTDRLLEVVVVDDASTDGTADRVAAIAAQDSRVRLTRLSQNREKHSRNEGIKQARGQYIALLNSDDIWRQWKLSKQIDVLERHPYIGACFTGADVVNESGALVHDSWANGVFTTINRSQALWLKQLLHAGSAMHVSSAVIRRSALDEIGLFNEQLRFMSDLDMWIRIARVADLWIVPEQLSAMRIVGHNNLSAPTPKKNRRMQQELAIVRKQYRSVANNIASAKHVRTMSRITAWLQKQAHASRAVVTTIPLSQSKQWSYTKEGVVHTSGRFFAVRGYTWSQQSKTYFTTLFDQQEIGTLGFLLRKGRRRLTRLHKKPQPQIFVQAKVEPGNVLLAQLAPTYQATASNHDGVHGGTRAPYSEFFTPKNPRIVYDALQSEQGTRFYHKRNRDVVAILGVGSRAPKQTTMHQWLNVTDVFDAAGENYLVNSDARSVLTCAPWEMLVPWKPFTRYNDSWGDACARSYHRPAHEDVVKRIDATFSALQQRAPVLQTVSLQDSGAINQQEWKDNGGTTVRHIAVKIEGREVPQWDQPIFYSNTMGVVDLYCARIDGVLRFLFQAVWEPGLHNSIELQPTVYTLPGESVPEPSILHPVPNAVIRAECLQSEEGGRFLYETNWFRIIDCGDIEGNADIMAKQYTGSSHAFWLTLADIRELLNKEGYMTNESRSALSLLLRWL